MKKDYNFFQNKFDCNFLNFYYKNFKNKKLLLPNILRLIIIS